jgi:1-acyl-sn-glycerol-3-phosphate acyltransferase
MSKLVPDLPPNAPRTNGNAFTRWIGRCVLRVTGWRMVGEWPNEKKLVIIAAPHSSQWDAFWGISVKVAMSLAVVFMAKKEAFVGPVGWILKLFGGVPVNRQAAGGVVEQVAEEIRTRDQMWFVLAPEGTRKAVERWKPGFWKIAKLANVPVLCVWFDYPNKLIGIGPIAPLTDDAEADLVRIRALFAGKQGKHRGA